MWLNLGCMQEDESGEVGGSPANTRVNAGPWCHSPQENRPHRSEEGLGHLLFPPGASSPTDSLCPQLGQLSPHSFCPWTPGSMERTTLVTSIPRAATRWGRPRTPAALIQGMGLEAMAASRVLSPPQSGPQTHTYASIQSPAGPRQTSSRHMDRGCQVPALL